MYFSSKATPFTLILSVLFLFTGIYVFAWAPPTSAPPAGNVSAPLNTGNTGQTKSGGLILNTGGAVNGLIIDKGKVGIGTISPANLLDVIGGSIMSDTGFCIGTSCITSWPAGGGSSILRVATCHTIGTATCNYTFTCPAGETIRSLGTSLTVWSTSEPYYDKMANAAYATLKDVSDTNPCVGQNSCPQSSAGSGPTQDLWGMAIGSCSAGAPVSSALPTGLYGYCWKSKTDWDGDGDDEWGCGGPLSTNVSPPMTCSVPLNGRSECECPSGYQIRKTGSYTTASLESQQFYTCYKH